MAHLGDHPMELVLVDGDDARQQVERVAGVVGDVDQRPSPWETGPAPTRPRLEELVADALVVAHAQHDVLDVGADRLAHRGDGVDEADLGGQALGAYLMVSADAGSVTMIGAVTPM